MLYALESWDLRSEGLQPRLSTAEVPNPLDQVASAKQAISGSRGWTQTQGVLNGAYFSYLARVEADTLTNPTLLRIQLL